MSASIEPVAWMFDEEGFTTEPDQGGTPLYTADQLREAQVKVLREAAEMIRCKRNVGDVFRAEAELIRVADELERDAIRGFA